MDATFTSDRPQSYPMTPPSEMDSSGSDGDWGQFVPAVSMGLSVIAAERDGIAHLHNVYSTSPMAQNGFENTVRTLVRTTQRHGTLIVSGVGKSGLIGRKMVATFNSLGIRSMFLHPTEALHGDLGMIGPNDALLLITFSGATSELVSLVSQLPSHIPLVLMSSAIPKEDAPLSSLPLFAARPGGASNRDILLPTPVPVPETALFGIAAPTVSTTVTLALGDAIAIAAAHKLHENRQGVKDIFRKYHPGGAIGRAAIKEAQQENQTINVEPQGLDSPLSLAGSTLGDVTDTEMDLIDGPLPEPDNVAGDGRGGDDGTTGCQASGKGIELERLDRMLEQARVGVGLA